MLTVFGSVALDTIRTPARTLRNVLGGAATYAGVAASFFARTGLIAVVGEDFSRTHRGVLSGHLDLQGLAVERGRTFRYDGRYDRTLSSRQTLKTELNVLADFKPAVPEEYRGSRFVYLANNDPEQNVSILKEFDRVRFSMCDTIDFWISTKPRAVRRMIGATDAVIINDEEARLLTKEHNLAGCARKMTDWGADYVVIKKGEHGSLLFHDGAVFAAPGFPLDGVADPTGAGDSFAGAMIGYLASKNSVSRSSIRRSILYGNVMGSFAVQRYGLDGLLGLKRSYITKRIKSYERMIRP